MAYFIIPYIKVFGTSASMAYLFITNEDGVPPQEGFINKEIEKREPPGTRFPRFEPGAYVRFIRVSKEEFERLKVDMA